MSDELPQDQVNRILSQPNPGCVHEYTGGCPFDHCEVRYDAIADQVAKDALLRGDRLTVDARDVRAALHTPPDERTYSQRLIVETAGCDDCEEANRA